MFPLFAQSKDANCWFLGLLRGTAIWLVWSSSLSPLYFLDEAFLKETVFFWASMIIQMVSSLLRSIQEICTRDLWCEKDGRHSCICNQVRLTITNHFVFCTELQFLVLAIERMQLCTRITVQECKKGADGKVSSFLGKRDSTLWLTCMRRAWSKSKRNDVSWETQLFLHTRMHNPHSW